MDQTLSRRSGLITGAKLAFAAPAVVAALRAGVAAADTGTQTNTNTASPSPGQIAGTEGLTRMFQLSLCAASGQSGSGLLQFFGSNGTLTGVNAVLSGLAANQQYSLVFLPSGGGSTTLFTLPTTNGSGSLSLSQLLPLGTTGTGALGLTAEQITALTKMLNGTTAGSLVLRALNGTTDILVVCSTKNHTGTDTGTGAGSQGANQAQNQSRPGEGNGDENHNHSGAPGQKKHS